MEKIGQIKTTRFDLKEGTKTVYVERSQMTQDLTQEQYDNITSKETLAFFRRLGATETATREYTRRGYVITRLVSKSPSREEKVIREFMFYY
jgi:hypothetical protein